MHYDVNKIIPSGRQSDAPVGNVGWVINIKVDNFAAHKLRLSQLILFSFLLTKPRRIKLNY